MKPGTKDSDSRRAILMKLHAQNVYELKRHAVEQELLQQDNYRSMFQINQGIRTVNKTLRGIKMISGYCHQTEILKDKPNGNFPNLSLRYSSRDFRKGNKEEIISILNLNGKCTTSLPNIRLDHTKGNANGFPSESGLIDLSISSLLACNKILSKSAVTVINDHRTGIYGNGSQFSSESFGTKDSAHTRVTTAMSKTAIKEGLRELVLEYNRPRTMSYIEKEKVLREKVSAFINGLSGDS